MHRRALFALLLLAVPACSAADARDTEAETTTPITRSVSQPIVNGTPDTAAGDSVVYIQTGSQGSFCTGTFIAPNLVLTARHCVAEPDETQECGAYSSQMAPSAFSIFTGLQHGTRVAGGSKVIIDSSKPNNMCGNDIALIQLDRDVPNAIVSKVRFTALTTGESASTSGYGDDGSGKVTNGRFVRTGVKVDAVGPIVHNYVTATGQQLPVTLPAGEIVTGESTCFGDSGGPLFDAAGNIIGLTSRGISENCNDNPSIYTDTVSHAAAITAAAVAAGHPLAAAAPLPGASGTTTPQSDVPAADDGADDTTSDDSSDEPVVPTKKKKKSSTLGATSAGCSAAPGAPLPAPASSLPLVGLALAAMAASRARARVRATTPRP